MGKLLQNDMSKEQKFGDLVPCGWYHVRIDKVTIKDSATTPGAKVAWFNAKIQNEPLVGRVVPINASLQSHALSTLKGIYDAAGYTPGPEGHDPEQVLNGEMLICVEHDVYQGQKRTKVPGWGIKSLQEGLPTGATLGPKEATP